MKCQATLKELECDWPKEHPGWAHVNKNKQTLWTDKGIQWSSKHVCYWLSLPKEMKPLLDIPHIDSLIGRS